MQGTEILSYTEMLLVQTRVNENETHEIPCDLHIQTDYLIETRTPQLKLIEKKTCRIVDFDVPWITEYK